MRTYISNALRILILSISLSQLAFSSEAREEKLAITEWPADSRPKIGIENVEVQFDGPIEYRMVFKFPNFDIMIENNGEWENSPSTPPRYSILVSNMDFSNLTFGISRFKKEEFIADLSSEKWNPYIEYLEADPKTKKITFQSYSRERPTAPYIPGNYTRQVAYEYDLPKGRTGKTREIFSFIEGELIVFAFSGTKEWIDSMREEHNLLLTRLEVIR